MRDELDDILSRRAVPQARPHLAELIIASAAPRPARAPRLSWKGAFDALQEAFVLPHPALALGFILVLGLTFGFNAETAAAAQDGMMTTQELSSFMRIKDSFDVGEWL